MLMRFVSLVFELSRDQELYQMEKVHNFRPASIKRHSPCRKVVYTLLVSTQILHMPGLTHPFAVESGKMDDADIKVTSAKYEQK